MGPNGVEACGVDVARVVFALIHINAGHVAGRAVVTDPAGALVRPVDVLALFVHPAWIVLFLTLIYILTKSPVHQDEACLAQAREGTLVVDAYRFISATSVIHQTLVHITAKVHPVSRVTRLTGAVVGAREVKANGIGVALLSQQALILIHTREAVSPVPC